MYKLFYSECFFFLGLVLYSNLLHSIIKYTSLWSRYIVEINFLWVYEVFLFVRSKSTPRWMNFTVKRWKTVEELIFLCFKFAKKFSFSFYTKTTNYASVRLRKKEKKWVILENRWSLNYEKQSKWMRSRRARKNRRPPFTRHLNGNWKAIEIKEHLELWILKRAINTEWGETLY